MVKTPCEKCKHKKCQKEGKPCQKVENLLRKQGIYSADYIRPELPSKVRPTWGRWREVPLSSINYDEETGTLYDPFPRE